MAYEGLTSSIRVFKRSLALCEAELLDRLQQETKTGAEPKKATQVDSINSEYGTLDQRRRTQQLKSGKSAYGRPASGNSLSASRGASPLNPVGRGPNHTVAHLSATSS